VAGRKKKRSPILKHRRIIGDAIRWHRNAASLTQESLGELAELNPKYLGEVERGEKIISIEALLRVAKAVKTPMRGFFGGL
jgi:XRE family transcriptional regulator, regulator of sulfur utilization